ncbi:MAG: hypothetical protein PHS74_10260 [Lachnospiraceae bacterium]|nr:hypothetical protein [Lachnospiraceae bacterium]
MKELISKHRKGLLITILVLIVIFSAATWQRNQILSKSTETKLANPARNKEIVKNEFYKEQLNEKELSAYQMVTEHLDNLEGGLISFDEPISVQEYIRLCNAIDYSGQNYFYGFLEIPMTKDNQYVDYKNAKKDEADKECITQCILFLSCAEGINQSGRMDDSDYVTNLDKILPALARNDAEKVNRINEQIEQTDKILDEVVAGIPQNYGVKDTIDYFLQWMTDNLTRETNVSQGSTKITTMEKLLSDYYVCGNEACVVEKQATTAGYVKVLTALCNRAGIPSHVVSGLWNNRSAYAMTYVKIGEEDIFIDAAGVYQNKLGNQRYLNEIETLNHVTFVEYFNYR